MKKLILGILLASFCFTSKAQVFDTPRDGVYDKIHTVNRVPVPYAPLRQADVFWAKRIWRVIDMREKINQPLYYPAVPTNGRINIMTVIIKGLEEGSLTAYDAQYDDFTLPRQFEDIMRQLNKVDTITATKPYPPYETYDTIIENKFDVATVTMFRVKEDWFFDKQRSVLDVRILGICPVTEDYDDQGEFKGYKPLFWIYFPDARPLFAKNEVFNRFNDGQRLSFDDIFFKRMFGSYVMKESNVYDRRISEYCENMDALLEADRIKNDIFVFEHDVWEY